jgi:hypothetical protein
MVKLHRLVVVEGELDGLSVLAYSVHLTKHSALEIAMCGSGAEFG